MRQKSVMAPDTNQQHTAKEVTAEKKLKGNGTFQNLLSLGKNISCNVEFTPATGGGAAKGTIFVSGTKMRSNFQVNTPHGVMDMHMIKSDEDGYMWGNTGVGSMALKFAIKPTDQANSEKKQFDLNQQVNYDCSSWNVDATVFVPPTEITFSEMSTLMPSSNTGSALKTMPGMKAVQCGTCEKVTDASAKAQCKQAFSCQ